MYTSGYHGPALGNTFGVDWEQLYKRNTSEGIHNYDTDNSVTSWLSTENDVFSFFIMDRYVVLLTE